MKARSPLLLLTALAVTLSACAGGGQRRGPPPEVINRALKNAPGEAQPSTIVAREIEYYQAAQAEGQYTAGARFAAPGALLHGRNGPVDAAALFAATPNPETPVEWGPRTVVMSCDGALAVSAGRFRDQEGFVGDYVTTWVRQSDNSYKWTYDVAGRDNPQPPPRKQFEDGDIVVTALSSVLGLIGTCPRPGAPTPPPPIIPGVDDGTSGDMQLSSDGTMRWRWEHRPDGIKYVAVDYFYEGEWVTAIEESFTSPLETSAQE